MGYGHIQLTLVCGLDAATSNDGQCWAQFPYLLQEADVVPKGFSAWKSQGFLAEPGGGGCRWMVGSKARWVLQGPKGPCWPWTQQGPCLGFFICPAGAAPVAELIWTRSCVRDTVDRTLISIQPMDEPMPGDERLPRAGRRSQAVGQVPLEAQPHRAFLCWRPRVSSQTGVGRGNHVCFCRVWRAASTGLLSSPPPSSGGLGAPKGQVRPSAPIATRPSRGASWAAKKGH